jgi:hypothetical protein
LRLSKESGGEMKFLELTMLNGKKTAINMSKVEQFTGNENGTTLWFGFSETDRVEVKEDYQTIWNFLS